MTEQAETLIRVFEGLRLKAYQDSVGVWTIGYGETQGVTPGMCISIEQAESYLQARLGILEDEILTLVRVPINDNQLSSLESFCYNLGIGAFAHSTMLKLINKGNFQDAANEFDVWVHAGGKILPGLIKRREAEKELFLTPIEGTEYD